MSRRMCNQIIHLRESERVRLWEPAETDVRVLPRGDRLAIFGEIRSLLRAKTFSALVNRLDARIADQSGGEAIVHGVKRVKKRFVLVLGLFSGCMNIYKVLDTFKIRASYPFKTERIFNEIHAPDLLVECFLALVGDKCKRVRPALVFQYSEWSNGEKRHRRRREMSLV